MNASAAGTGADGRRGAESQAIWLFALYLAAWTLGNGLIPLLPLRAMALGLSRGEAGLFLGALNFCLVIGSLSGSRVLARVGSVKRTLIAAAAGRVVAFPLMALPSAWGLGVFGCVCWLLLGLELCVLAIHANLMASPTHRGRTLAIIFCTSPLGAMLGGAGMGLIANRWGFTVVILGAAWLPAASLALAFGLAAAAIAPPARVAGAQAVKLPRILGLLAALNFIASLAGLTVRAASPLLIKSHGLDLGAPALASALGGLVALPVALIMGPASDRFGRFPVLALGYAAVALGVLALVFARDFWGFAASAIFASLFIYGTAGVRTAVVGDIATPAQLPRSMSLYDACAWSGGLVGFAATGYGLQFLGPAYLVAIAALAGCASAYTGLRLAHRVPARVGRAELNQWNEQQQ